MQHLNIDWDAFVKLLPVWRALSDDGRLAYLTMKGTTPIPRASIPPSDEQILQDAGLIFVNTNRQVTRLESASREFSKAMRAMHRHPLGPTSDLRNLRNYFDDHLVTDERTALAPAQHSNFHWASLADSSVIADEDWLKPILNASSARASKWERARLPEHKPGRVDMQDAAPFFGDAAVFKATKQLLKAALDWPEPVPIETLPSRFEDIKPEVLWQSVMAGIRYLMLFPRLEGDELTPVIGVWPRIAFLRHRPAPRLPAPVEPDETFHLPLLMEDMVTVLVAAATDPLRVLADGSSLYARDIARMEAGVTSLPDWLMQGATKDELGYALYGVQDPELRLVDAVRQCEQVGLLKALKGSRHRNALAISDAGRDWLGAQPKDRIRSLAAAYREPEPSSKARDRRGQRRQPSYLDEPPIWCPLETQWSYRAEFQKTDWRAAMVDAFTHDGDADAFLPLNDLLCYHAQENNPLIGRRRQGSYGPPIRSIGVYDPLQHEKTWSSALRSTIGTILLPCGGVELARAGEKVAIRLHPIGRYMLGLADDFTYETAPEGAVFIQPNFEITFMGSSPRAEATLGRLAERTGASAGTLLRITRDSILAAAAAGITAEDALRDLTEASTKPVPDNVRREIKSWFDTTRRIQLKQSWLINSPDEETARKVVAAVGKHARQHTSTLIELTATAKQHPTVLRKLAKAGIFID